MAAPLLTGVLAAAAVGWGLPVSRVEIEAPGVPSVYQLRHVFGVAEGSALSRPEIRAGVQALIATGQVEDVVVSVDQSEAGGVIRVHIQPASRVRSVTILGLPRPAVKRVRAALDLSEGDALKVPTFQGALERARQDLRDDGYPNAKLDPDLLFEPGTGEVAVTVRGELGAPLTVHDLAAPGSGLEPGQLWEVCNLSPGQRLAARNLEGARRRLAVFLRRKGYWEAEVDTATVSESPTGASVRFGVKSGSHFELQVEGLKRTKALEVEALPFVRGDETFSEAALESVVRRVRMFLQHDGKLLAKVSGEVIEKGSDRILHLKVEPGARTPILAVRFPGLHSVPEKELRQRVGARPGHFWRWGGEPVDDDSLQADASSVLATLQEAGFADARVDDPRVVPSGGKVAIEFPVEEGARTAVARVAVEGFPAKVTQPTLPLAREGPWSQDAEERSRSALEEVLQGAGFPDARVTGTHTCEANRCTVTFKAELGEQAVIDRVVVAGLARTSRRVVLRVAGLQEGEAAGPEAQLAAQRRLLALGIFERASVRPIPGQETGTRRGLLLDLAEGPTGAYAFGLGWDTEQKAKVSFSWSELNLFGTAHSLSFDSTVSSMEQRFQLTYREPRRLGVLGFPTWVSIYQTQQTLTSFDLLERGMWVELGDRQRRPLRALLRYDYQIVDNTAPASILSELERNQTRLHIASLTPILEWDTRDDILSPHRGAYASLQWQSAFKVFRADAAFDKVSALFATFVPAQGGVLAFSVQGGAIEPRDRVAGPDNLQLPLNVRFFAGGRITQRAFPIDLLGIQGETIDCEKLTLADGAPSDTCKVPVKLVATGGAGLLVTSLEWRFPVVGAVGASLFVDGGNVWPDWRSVRLDAIRWGAGIGLRVETPVGPLRLEYGWKFKQLTYDFPNTADGVPRVVKESPGELFLSFGNAF